MLKMFVACARNSSILDSFSGTIFVNAISNTFVPGTDDAVAPRIAILS